MSFICSKCKKAKPAHSKPVRLVLSTREKVYNARLPDSRNLKGDKGGAGWEIEKEGQFCEECAATISRATLTGRESFEVALKAAPSRWASK